MRWIKPMTPDVVNHEGCCKHGYKEGSGACAECEAIALRAENERLKVEQAAYVAADQAEWDDLRTEVKRLKKQIDAMHDAGLGKVDTGGTRLSEAMAEIERLKAELSAERAALDLLTALHEVKP